MTTDELINLVAARDQARFVARGLDRELEKHRVKGGLYRGSDGRCVSVTDSVDRPSQFVLIDLHEELRLRND